MGAYRVLGLPSKANCSDRRPIHVYCDSWPKRAGNPARDSGICEICRRYGDVRSKLAALVPPGGTSNSIFGSFQYFVGILTFGLALWSDSSDMSVNSTWPVIPTWFLPTVAPRLSDP